MVRLNWLAVRQMSVVAGAAQLSSYCRVSAMRLVSATSGDSLTSSTTTAEVQDYSRSTA